MKKTKTKTQERSTWSRVRSSPLLYFIILATPMARGNFQVRWNPYHSSNSSYSSDIIGSLTRGTPGNSHSSPLNRGLRFSEAWSRKGAERDLEEAGEPSKQHPGEEVPPPRASHSMKTIPQFLTTAHGVL